MSRNLFINGLPELSEHDYQYTEYIGPGDPCDNFIKEHLSELDHLISQEIHHDYLPSKDLPVELLFLKDKKILVYGHAGDYAGFRMSNGVLIIKGDAGGFLGYRMKGGIICVQGDVKDCCGYGMEGGIIRVMGSVGEDLGKYKKGGEIILGF